MKLHTIGSNQTQLSLPDGIELFFSYDIPVAAFIPSMGYVRTEKYHSVTTSKHINRWTDKTQRTVTQKFLDELVSAR